MDLNELLPSPTLIEKYFDRLWPICRSLTGDGLRSSFSILKELVPLELHEVPSGTNVLDWTVPKEWNIEDAWIEDESGAKVVDFKQNNLHVLGYSQPVDVRLSKAELEAHLYSLPDQPDAVPYVTSYYKERWGFCLSHRQRQQMKDGTYRAVIKSTLKNGSLTYGDYLLEPTTRSGDIKEILISTYLCHPSLANNELSGPLVTSFLYRALAALPERKFRYRFVVVPETIGSITYLAKHGDQLRKSCIAGLVVTCCGDDKNITYKKTWQGNTELDQVVELSLRQHAKPYNIVEFFPSGSDERQYCSPGFRLPVGSLMRSMYGKYPEYHTSLDNKEFISFEAMRESVFLYLKVLMTLELNSTYQNLTPRGEPMLSKRDLYPSLGSQKTREQEVDQIMWLLSYSDGQHDLLKIAEKSGHSVIELANVALKLKEKGLLGQV